MNILLVGAMENEVKYFLSVFKLNETIERDGFTFYICEYKNKNVILVSSGIGRTMAGLLIGVASSNFKIDKVINIGIAGGISPVTLKDVVACSNYVYGDVDLTFFEGYEFGQMSKCPKVFSADKEMIDLALKSGCKEGTICTCDSFTSKIKDVNQIKSKLNNVHNILCFDMESTAFMQCCYYLKLPFIAIRSVSDVVGAENQNENYSDSNETPAMKANNVVLDIIKKL